MKPALICLALSVFAAAVPARIDCGPHPYHVSIAEAEFNAASSSLEVALCVFPLDLERALLLRAGRRVDLESHSDVDRQLAEYLRAVFIVTRPDGERARLTWIGKEVGPSDAWLYFEFDLPTGIRDVRIANRIFHELELDQVNTIALRVGETVKTLICPRAGDSAASPPLVQTSLLRNFPCRGRFLWNEPGPAFPLPCCQNGFEH